MKLRLKDGRICLFGLLSVWLVVIWLENGLYFLSDIKVVTSNFLGQIIKNFDKPLLRYLLGASFFYFVFWHALKDKKIFRKIQNIKIKGDDIKREIIISLINVGTLAAISIPMLRIIQSSYSRIYSDINLYGGFYAVLSFVFLFLAIDTFYYWFHRGLHHPRLFRYAHRIHHLSMTPTPWSTFAIAPFEQIFISGFYMAVVCLIPLHPFVLSSHLLVGLIRQFIGHLGYEIFPTGTLTSWYRWNLTVTHHDMHHQYIRCNYGLYFTFWDNFMGTNHKNYQQEFLKNSLKVTHV